MKRRVLIKQWKRELNNSNLPAIFKLSAMPLRNKYFV